MISRESGQVPTLRTLEKDSRGCRSVGVQIYRYVPSQTYFPVSHRYMTREGDTLWRWCLYVGALLK